MVAKVIVEKYIELYCWDKKSKCFRILIPCEVKKVSFPHSGTASETY